jgi:hypothetical protein
MDGRLHLGDNAAAESLKDIHRWQFFLASNGDHLPSPNRKPGLQRVKKNA